MKNSWWAFIVFVAVMLCGGAVCAQDTGQFSPEQIKLNNEAGKASMDKDYETAEVLYKANLKMGEFDVTWLNLGRTYAKRGKCIEAQNAYDQVLLAPSVTLKGSVNTNKDVKKTLLRYQQDLLNECSVVVVFDCESFDLKVTVDDTQEFVCERKPFYLQPGKHNFTGRFKSGKLFEANVVFEDAFVGEVQLRPDHIGEITNANGSPDPAKQCENNDSPEKEIIYVDNDWEQTSKNYKIAGGVLLGAGIVLAGVGAGLVGMQMAQANKSGVLSNAGVPSFMTGLVLTGVGGASLIGGAGLLIANHVISQKKAAQNTPVSGLTLSPVFSPDYSGLGLNWAF